MNTRDKLLAYRLKTARQDKNLTQQELATETGINVGQISHYETGHSRPGPDNIVKLSRALGRSIDWLMSAEDP